MLLRFFCSLLALSGAGCPHLPAPIAVSTQVPARLTPVRVSITGQVLDADSRRPVVGVPVQGLRYARHLGQSAQTLQVSGGDFTPPAEAASQHPAVHWPDLITVPRPEPVDILLERRAR